MNPIILPLAIVNSRADWVFQPWFGTKSRRRKTLNSNLIKLHLKKIDLVSSCPCEGFRERNVLVLCHINHNRSFNARGEVG